MAKQTASSLRENLDEYETRHAEYIEARNAYIKALEALNEAVRTIAAHVRGELRKSEGTPLVSGDEPECRE